MAPESAGHPDWTGARRAPGRGSFILIQDERIAAAKYQTVGRGPTIAAGSMLTEMIAGRSIAECRDLSIEDLIEARTARAG